MWFKNLRIYRFTQTFSLSTDELNAALSTHPFTPCNSQDLSRSGWVAPSDPKQSEADNLVHACQGFLMVCAKKQEKVLPAAVINEALEEKVAAISEAEGRPVHRKERQTIKDDVMMDLLPKAFVRSSLQFAYIAPEKGYIVINTASVNKAEELLTALRESIGSLPVVPLTSKQLPHQTMTQWLSDTTVPHPFTLGGECELADPKESSSVIRCKHQDLTSTEINNLLQSGMIITKLELNWAEGIDFVLDDQLGIKRLRFADDIQEKADAHDAENSAELFDIEFSVMTIELSAFIEHLVEALGGINMENQTVEEIVAKVEKNNTQSSGVDEVVFE